MGEDHQGLLAENQTKLVSLSQMVLDLLVSSLDQVTSENEN